jgi:hypothetical protein
VTAGITSRRRQCRFGYGTWVPGCCAVGRYGPITPIDATQRAPDQGTVEPLLFGHMFDMICGDRAGSTAMNGSKLTLQQLAVITDEQQITDIRAAAEVARATFDAWRQSPSWNRREKHHQRWSVLVDRVALVLAELPTDADLRTVIDAVGPLFNSWWPSSREQEATFSAAIDRLRYLTVWRPSQTIRPGLAPGGNPTTVPDRSPPGPRPSDLFSVNYRQ